MPTSLRSLRRRLKLVRQSLTQPQSSQSLRTGQIVYVSGNVISLIDADRYKKSIVRYCADIGNDNIFAVIGSMAVIVLLRQVSAVAAEGIVDGATFVIVEEKVMSKNDNDLTCDVNIGICRNRLCWITDSGDIRIFDARHFSKAIMKYSNSKPAEYMKTISPDDKTRFTSCYTRKTSILAIANQDSIYKISNTNSPNPKIERMKQGPNSDKSIKKMNFKLTSLHSPSPRQTVFSATLFSKAKQNIILLANRHFDFTGVVRLGDTHSHIARLSSITLTCRVAVVLVHYQACRSMAVLRCSTADVSVVVQVDMQYGVDVVCVNVDVGRGGGGGKRMGWVDRRITVAMADNSVNLIRVRL